MSAMIGEICGLSFGRGEEIAMFGGVVEGSDVEARLNFLHLI
jgi:hypothetical protein